jgi:hypothetical protein
MLLLYYGGPVGLRLPARRSVWIRDVMRLAASGEVDGIEAGGFMLGLLPPGDYYVVALDAADVDTAGELTDPRLLERLMTASRRVNVTATGTRDLTLRLTPLDR